MDVDDADLQDGVKVCAKSLIGRFLMNKLINKGVLEAAFNNIWRQMTGFKIEEIKPRFFQFFFDNKRDLVRILNSRTLS